MIFQGNLEIRNAEDAKKYKHLTKVTGYLYINSSPKLDAPKLESVGGYLYINSSAKLDALKSVGGYLSIYSSAKLDALKSVGGYLYIKENCELKAGKLYPGGYDKFKIYDGIHCVVLSTKQAHGVTILSCSKPKITNQKIVGEKFYIAQSGNYNAHGKTIAEAVAELAFKTGKRDVSEYKNLPAKTTKTPQEWAIAYRAITGACRYGTEQFIKSQGKLKKKYSLTEIIKITEGQYGHSEFKKAVAP